MRVLHLYSEKRRHGCRVREPHEQESVTLRNERGEAQRNEGRRKSHYLPANMNPARKEGPFLALGAPMVCPYDVPPWHVDKELEIFIVSTDYGVN